MVESKSKSENNGYDRDRKQWNLYMTGANCLIKYGKKEKICFGIIFIGSNYSCKSLLRDGRKIKSAFSVVGLCLLGINLANSRRNLNYVLLLLLLLFELQLQNFYDDAGMLSTE